MDAVLIEGEACSTRRAMSVRERTYAGFMYDTAQKICKSCRSVHTMQAKPLASPVAESGFVRRLLIDGAHTAIKLAHPLRNSTAVLCERIESLIRADRRKDEFLSILSHELRSPL